MTNWTEEQRALALELVHSLAELKDRKAARFEFYKPHRSQRAFHAIGATARERLLMAGNQVGKTTAGAAELAMHLAGTYPPWWKGYRFPGPIAAWAAGVSAESAAAAIQTHLLGGSPTRQALLPSSRISRRVYRNRTGLNAPLEGLAIRHASGLGESLLTFKSYAQGRESWQGATLDLVWFDEEPNFDIYMEGLSRTNATSGIVYTTFTPLKGRSRLVERFIDIANVDRALVQFPIDDARHLSKQQKAKILQSYPEFERQSRALGVPLLGSGRVFPLPPEALSVVPFDIPVHWPRLGALDFGWEHPTAAVEIAWDRDFDVIYVVRCYRVAKQTPKRHCQILAEWGNSLLWAWPHDGLAHEKGSGEGLAAQYRHHGLSLLPAHVTLESGGNSVEAGLSLMLERMESGRFKVFANLSDWFEEFTLYHRVSGRVQKVRDDLMSATRYALMGLRFARPRNWPNTLPSTPVSDHVDRYDPLEWAERY